MDGLARRKRRPPSVLATSFAEAAGLDGRQKRGLVLSSSQRVSQVTSPRVVGVRYPELVTHFGEGRNFGRCVTMKNLSEFLSVF